MEVGIRYNIRDTWKFYRENREHQTKIKDDEYAKIGTALFKLLMEKVHDGHEVVLPFKLGSVYIRGKKTEVTETKGGKPKGVMVSWGKTRKLWIAAGEEMGLTLNEYIATVPPEERKLVYSFNEETNGYSYKLVWDKSEALAYNRHLYSLAFAKDNKRRLHKAILAGKEYILKN
jgi:hypothetical protein